MRLRGGAAVAAALTTLALAATAQAAQRYAAPSGGGPKAECPQANPCSLKDALEGAKANDEVIVTGGTYMSASPMFLSPEATGAYVHGDFGAPRPTIVGAIPGTLLGSAAQKARFAYLEVTNTSASAAALNCSFEGIVERVKTMAKGTNAIGLQQAEACLARDSVFRVEGESSVGVASSGIISSSSAAIRNVTAIASGPKSSGLRTTSLGFSGSFTTVVRNSIVSGTEQDLFSATGIFFNPGNIDVAYSNFDVAKQEPGTTIAQGPGNQTAAPAFVDAADGDYREAAGSPTIDGGSTDGIAATDFDGNQRNQGAAPDIGAFEFVPPPPPKGQIESLSLSPRKFRAANAGEAIVSAKKRARAPLGATVAYSLSAAATIEFFAQRRIVGRKAGGKCRKVTKANRRGKRCTLTYRLIKAGFAHSGKAGSHSFKFSGRLGGVALKPGGYRLLASTSAAQRMAGFKIVK